MLGFRIGTDSVTQGRQLAAWFLRRGAALLGFPVASAVA